MLRSTSDDINRYVLHEWSGMNVFAALASKSNDGSAIYSTEHAKFACCLLNIACGELRGKSLFKTFGNKRLIVKAKLAG